MPGLPDPSYPPHPVYSPSARYGSRGTQCVSMLCVPLPCISMPSYCTSTPLACGTYLSVLIHMYSSPTEYRPSWIYPPPMICGSGDIDPIQYHDTWTSRDTDACISTSALLHFTMYYAHCVALPYSGLASACIVLHRAQSSLRYALSLCVVRTQVHASLDIHV